MCIATCVCSPALFLLLLMQQLHWYSLALTVPACLGAPAGLGAKALFGDDSCYPVRGHVLRVRAPWVSLAAGPGLAGCNAALLWLSGGMQWGHTISWMPQPRLPPAGLQCSRSFSYPCLIQSGQHPPARPAPTGPALHQQRKRAWGGEHVHHPQLRRVGGGCGYGCIAVWLLGGTLTPGHTHGEGSVHPCASTPSSLALCPTVTSPLSSLTQRRLCWAARWVPGTGTPRHAKQTGSASLREPAPCCPACGLRSLWPNG